MFDFSYDKTDAHSIEAYAKKLIGHTFYEVISGSFETPNVLNEESDKKIAERNKGALGILLEKYYFGYEPNSNSAADFKEAGVELKTTSFEITKKNKYRARERLSLTNIDYKHECPLSLYDSHLWEKCKRILLVFYFRNRGLDNRLLYPIKYVALFTPSEVDLKIIEEDYRIIASKIISGKAEELSEKDTCYLGASTKGQTAATSLVKQFYPPFSMAKTRSFCYKNSYMTFVLNEYFVKNEESFEAIIKDANELANKSFEDVITSKLNKYIGKTDKELCEMFDRQYNNNKSQWTELTYRILGIKSNQAAEFKKANISVKVIRVEENGKIKQNVSFPPFKYKEIINEEWEESTLHNYFDETRFLIVVYRKKDNHYVLEKTQFWSMPSSDLETSIKDTWVRTVDTIKEGVKFTFEKNAKGIVVRNNLPKTSENDIVHVRPHASKRYYRFLDGTVIGDGTPSNANELPDGTLMATYSFWLNNTYILKQITK